MRWGCSQSDEHEGLVGLLLEACLADETGCHLACVPDVGITTEGVEDLLAVTF